MNLDCITHVGIARVSDVLLDDLQLLIAIVTKQLILGLADHRDRRLDSFVANPVGVCHDSDVILMAFGRQLFVNTAIANENN